MPNNAFLRSIAIGMPSKEFLIEFINGRNSSVIPVAWSSKIANKVEKDMQKEEKPKKEKPVDVKVIIKYEEKVEGKDAKSLQGVIQKLFNSHIIKVIQNINRGK